VIDEPEKVVEAIFNITKLVRSDRCRTNTRCCSTCKIGLSNPRISPCAASSPPAPCRPACLGAAERRPPAAAGRAATAAGHGSLRRRLEPQVTIVKSETETREEFRVKGKLYMVKVTPAVGKPYYLVDRQGDGIMVDAGLNQRPSNRRCGSFTAGKSCPYIPPSGGMSLPPGFSPSGWAN
jgi:hypothetical protein